MLTPGKVFEWSLVYDPAANGGKGEIHVTLGKETVTLALKKGLKAEGARFDRFGLFNSTAGGQLVRIFLDDLKYTAAPRRARPGSSYPGGAQRPRAGRRLLAGRQGLASSSRDKTVKLWIRRPAR